MKKILFILALLIPTIALGRGDINIIGNFGAAAYVLKYDTIINNTQRMLTMDVSFDDKTQRSFNGITLERILELAGADTSNLSGVTIIASNDYVTFVPMEEVTYSPTSTDGNKVMIAYEQDDEMLPRKRGGPYKQMWHHEANKGGSAYNWFVRALLLGEPQGATLSVGAGSIAERVDVIFNSDGLYDDGENLQFLDNIDWTRPRGDHFVVADGTLTDTSKFDGLTESEGDNTPHLTESRVEVAGYNLLEIMKNEGFTDAEWKGILVKTLTGKVFNIPPEMLEDPDVLLVTIYGARKLSVTKGGPLAVKFPVEKWTREGKKSHKKWLTAMPKFGLLYFVTELQVP